MLTVVTGAAGFVGRALAARMAARGCAGRVVLLDREPAPLPGAGFEAVTFDICDHAALRDAVRGADRVVHLAALPGGAAEADPAVSQAINLEVALALIEALRGSSTRLVLASSIAVFGAPLPAFVDDATPPVPTMTYGVHKRMVELTLADAARRGLDAVALRLPGIIARPAVAAGFKSAFWSDVFTAMRDGRDLALPVGPGATGWLMSARRCADNLIHALESGGPPVLTLPALTVRVDALVAEIARRTGANAGRIAYEPDPAVEAQFGAYPPLDTSAADARGYRHDGSLAALVEAAFAGLAQERQIETCQ